MQTIQTIQFYQDTREERLPGFAPEFPYIATRCEIGGDTYRFAPWHWHQAVELFVIQSGTLVYDTPARRLVFPPGSGGFVNSNVLHTTPGAYLQQYRIRQACRLLAETQQPLGEIGYACGLGSASYFGKQFREVMGCTPSVYRAQMAGL